VITALIRKEIRLEFRQKSTLGGVLIYITGTIFTSALCFAGKVDKPTWNALFWVITLFTSVTISGKSFLKETGGQSLFNYLHYPPSKFIIAKMLYNMVFMVTLSFITFIFYSFFISAEVGNPGLFLAVLVFASSGLAAVLSLMSAIAAKAGSGFALMSILSFPVAMPLILVSIKLSKLAMDGIEWAGVNPQYFIILIALNLLTATLAYLLFPYLWRD
jgi:heme exporter protein B